MHYLLRFIIAAAILLLGACDTNKSEELTTGRFVEIKPEKNEIEVVLLQKQPQLIQDFFLIDSALFKRNFCFSKQDLLDLIIHEIPPEEAALSYLINSEENFIRITNSACHSKLEFYLFELNGEKVAFLNQKNENMQRFEFLELNEIKKRWIKRNDFPKPPLPIYFNDLTEEEEQIVKEYGSERYAINAQNGEVKFSFSNKTFQRNIEEQAEITFNKKSQFIFILKNYDNNLYLQKLIIDSLQEENYFIACHDAKGFKKKENYTKFLVISENLTKFNIQSKYIQFSEKNFNVLIGKDTLDLREIQKENYYYFHRKNENPVILEIDEATKVIEKAFTFFKQDFEQ